MRVRHREVKPIGLQNRRLELARREAKGSGRGDLRHDRGTFRS